MIFIMFWFIIILEKVEKGSIKWRNGGEGWGGNPQRILEESENMKV